MRPLWIAVNEAMFLVLQSVRMSAVLLKLLASYTHQSLNYNGRLDLIIRLQISQ